MEASRHGALVNVIIPRDQTDRERGGGVMEVLFLVYFIFLAR